MSMMSLRQYLEARGARGSRKRFLEALAEVPDGTPIPGEALPAKGRE